MNQDLEWMNESGKFSDAHQLLTNDKNINKEYNKEQSKGIIVISNYCANNLSSCLLLIITIIFANTIL